MVFGARLAEAFACKLQQSQAARHPSCRFYFPDRSLSALSSRLGTGWCIQLHIPRRRQNKENPFCLLV